MGYQRSTLRFGLSVWVVCFAAACSGTPVVSPHPPISTESDSKPLSKATPLRPLALSHEMAANRFKQVTNASYTLWFGLDSQGNDFQGRTVVRFELKPKAREFGSKLEIDLEEGSLQSITLNGIAIQDVSKPERFDGHHIYFDLKEFSPGTNRVEIAYTHPYSTDGNGLHRFKDPVDGKVYLYSNLEPYRAHRLFPCFDQPDLKASYELTVEAPKDWEVISTLCLGRSLGWTAEKAGLSLLRRVQYLSLCPPCRTLLVLEGGLQRYSSSTFCEKIHRSIYRS